MISIEREERAPLVRASVHRAETLITKIGYGRRVPELARLRRLALELGVSELA